MTSTQMTKRTLATYLLLGAVIRESFSFWTGHPFDFELWVRLGYAIVHGGNPYTSLPPVPGLSFADIFSAESSATIAYLPFWPIVTGLMYVIYSAVGFGNRFAYYFLLKQPLIAADVTLAYLLYLYISSRTSRYDVRLWALGFWIFSPLTIILSGIWGMFDSIALCFVIASMMTKSYAKRCVLAGLGAFAKSPAIIYIIPAMRKVRRPWGLVISVGLPAFASLLTFALMGWSIPKATATLTSTLGKGGDSMSLWDVLPYLNYLGILSPMPKLYGSLGLIWIPAIIAFTVLAFYKLGFETDYGLVQSMLVITLVFFIFKARVTEQYALYLLAISVIDIALWNPQRKRLFIGTVFVVVLYLIINNSYLIRFLSPVYPDFSRFEMGIQGLEPIRRVVLFLLGSAFSCFNVAYLVKILRNNWRSQGKSDFSGHQLQ